MRKYEVQMVSGKTTYVSANNVKQAKDRVYLLGDSAMSVQPIFKSGKKKKGKKIAI